ncbi:hypothetical protein BDV93DRAFT_443954, partial [Ceratobasidium sp. AG-I]
VEVNGHEVRALLDLGSLGDFISTTVVDQLKLERETLARPIGLQMVVMGSRSSINFSVTAHLCYQTIDCAQHFDVINIDNVATPKWEVDATDNYDMILGTPFLFQHCVTLSVNPPAVSIGSKDLRPISGEGAIEIQSNAATQGKPFLAYKVKIDKCCEPLLEESKDLQKTMAKTDLPPLWATNHTIPLIDENKRYKWRNIQCPKPLQHLWDEKLKVYLDTGCWEFQPGSNATPMLILMKNLQTERQQLERYWTKARLMQTRTNSPCHCQT